MNFSSIILTILTIYTAFGILAIGLGYAAVYFIKPWRPDWWEQHICAPDPAELRFIRSISPTPSIESLLPNSSQS